MDNLDEFKLKELVMHGRTTIEIATEDEESGSPQWLVEVYPLVQSGLCSTLEMAVADCYGQVHPGKVGMLPRARPQLVRVASQEREPDGWDRVSVKKSELDKSVETC